MSASRRTLPLAAAVIVNVTARIPEVIAPTTNHGATFAPLGVHSAGFDRAELVSRRAGIVFNDPELLRASLRTHADSFFAWVDEQRLLFRDQRGYTRAWASARLLT